MHNKRFGGAKQLVVSPSVPMKGGESCRQRQPGVTGGEFGVHLGSIRPNRRCLGPPGPGPCSTLLWGRTPRPLPPHQAGHSRPGRGRRPGAGPVPISGLEWCARGLPCPLHSWRPVRQRRGLGTRRSCQQSPGPPTQLGRDCKPGEADLSQGN